MTIESLPLNEELVRENVLLSAALIVMRVNNLDQVDRIAFLQASLEAVMSIVTFSEMAAYIQAGEQMHQLTRWDKDSHNGAVLFRVRDMLNSKFPIGGISS